jgi:hypothetical protein
MILIINFIQLGTKIMNNEKYSLYLNEAQEKCGLIIFNHYPRTRDLLAFGSRFNGFFIQ